jgi:hypothetical protein
MGAALRGDELDWTCMTHVIIARKLIRWVDDWRVARIPAAAFAGETDAQSRRQAK